MINFSNYKKVKLKDVARFERAKKDVVYSAGCSTIQISATKGQLDYLEHDRTVDSQYVVIIPNEQILSKYLFFVLQKNVERFTNTYQQGINIVAEDVGEFPIELHDLETQAKVVELIQVVDDDIKQTEKEINEFKKIKDVFLTKMFV